MSDNETTPVEPYEIINGLSMAGGRWPLNRNAIETLAHDLRNEARKLRLHGETEDADKLDAMALKHEVTAKAMPERPPANAHAHPAFAFALNSHFGGSK